MDEAWKHVLVHKHPLYSRVYLLAVALINPFHCPVSPRAYLPVQLIEGRIAKDLCANLEAIRKYVTKQELQRKASKWTL